MAVVYAILFVFNIYLTFQPGNEVALLNGVVAGVMLVMLIQEVVDRD